MTECPAELPYVLVLAGHDPSGGAGLIADSEAIRAGGGWALTVPTALTVQNSCNVSAVIPQSGESILSMTRSLCDDFSPSALKIGLLASHEALMATVTLIDELRQRLPGLPVVWDPVLKAGGGHDFSSESLIKAARATLLPRVDVITPNRGELMRLGGSAVDVAQAADVPLVAGVDQAAVARELLAEGVVAVLVTGTDPLANDAADAACEQNIVHCLYRTEHDPLSLCCPRLAGSFHGSGCTLASHLAVRLARGMSLEAGWRAAQQATWQSLVEGQQRHLGGSLADAQSLPWR